MNQILEDSLSQRAALEDEEKPLNKLTI